MLFRKFGSHRNDDIEHAAAVWLARLDRGLTPGEQDDLSQWLGENPQHGVWLAKHKRTDRNLKKLASWRPVHGMRPDPDLLRAPGRASHWAVASALALSLAACMVLVVASRNGRSGRTGSPAPPVFDGAVVGHRVLADGSVVDLNRGAEVDVTYTIAERRVRLVKGEAHFAVAKNPNRPFVVQAGPVMIRAVGTAFQVSLQPVAVVVLVTEGKVAVAKPEAPAVGRAPASSSRAVWPDSPTTTMVEAGHQAVVSLDASAPSPQVVHVSREEIARILAWQPRQLEFTDTPLDQVVAEFNRENRIKIVVQDSSLSALRIGASLRSDNVNGLVRSLETSFNVKAERRGNTILLRRRESIRTGPAADNP